jgi:Arc/MetJ family transcription regulator
VSSKLRRKRSKSWVRRKNVNIDQSKLDRVREILGAETETEAIDQALSLLLREELIQSVEKIAGTGGLRTTSRTTASREEVWG